MMGIIHLLNGVVIGIIILQTSVVAPSVFRVLDEEHAGKFLRSLFPKFFVILVAVGILGAAFSFSSQQLNSAVVGLLTATLAMIAYLLIPATNRARDEGNNKRFGLLHGASVILTILVLIINAVNPILGY